MTLPQTLPKLTAALLSAVDIGTVAGADCDRHR